MGRIHQLIWHPIRIIIWLSRCLKCHHWKVQRLSLKLSRHPERIITRLTLSPSQFHQKLRHLGRHQRNVWCLRRKIRSPDLTERWLRLLIRIIEILRCLRHLQLQRCRIRQRRFRLNQIKIIQEKMNKSCLIDWYHYYINLIVYLI